MPDVAEVETKCPITGRVGRRARVATDPIVWTEESWDRLKAVPLIARPLARNTVEKFARNHEIWRVTTTVMDENKQAMIEADEFDAETMMVMFRELRAKQIRAEAEGKDALSPEMRRFIEEAKASGVTRCPIRDIEEQMGKCPVDFAKVTPAEAKKAVEQLMQQAAAAVGAAGRRQERLVSDARPSALLAAERPQAEGEFLPHVVAWNLTKRCNLRCSHCYISAGTVRDRRVGSSPRPSAVA